MKALTFLLSLLALSAFAWPSPVNTAKDDDNVPKFYSVLKVENF